MLTDNSSNLKDLYNIYMYITIHLHWIYNQDYREYMFVYMVKKKLWKLLSKIVRKC